MSLPGIDVGNTGSKASSFSEDVRLIESAFDKCDSQ